MMSVPCVIIALSLLVAVSDEASYTAAVTTCYRLDDEIRRHGLDIFGFHVCPDLRIRLGQVTVETI